MRVLTETKQATSRQRSAFSDALDIMLELWAVGIPPEEMVRAMEFNLEQWRIANNYMTATYMAKFNSSEESKEYSYD